jgi:hypothetical protein
MKAPDIEYRIGNSSDALALIEMMIEKLKFCGQCTLFICLCQVKYVLFRYFFYFFLFC